LENLRSQPTARRAEKAKLHESAHQREGQTILEFVNYLEEKEEYLQPFSEEHKRDILLNKIRDEYRQELVKSGRTADLTTRQQIVEAVSLMETFSHKRHRETRDYSGERDNNRKGRPYKKYKSSRH
jgi:hypothetical protein